MTTITHHDKHEWRRMADDAYAKGHIQVAATMKEYSELPRVPMDTARFDRIQTAYRNWLVFGEFPAN